MSNVPPSEDMTQPDPHQETAGDKAEEGQFTNEDGGNTGKETEGDDSAHQPHSGEPSSTDVATSQTLEESGKDNSTPPQDEDGSCNDHVVPQGNEPVTLTAGGDHSEEGEATQTIIQPTADVKKNDQVDGSKAGLNAGSTDTNITDTEAGGDNRSSPKTQKSESAPPTALLPNTSNEKRQDGHTTSIENIGSTTQESSGPGVPEVTQSSREIHTGKNEDLETPAPPAPPIVDAEKDNKVKEPEVSERPGAEGYPTERVDALETPASPSVDDRKDGKDDKPGHRGVLIGLGIAFAVLAILAAKAYPQHESLPQRDDALQIETFLTELKKVQTEFPSQRAELWNRSKIHLLRHLQTAQPTEPVSLILTAGTRAKQTLHCLANSLASTFSSAVNASVLHIYGASKASQDSDQVKLDIDSKLQGAFEGGKPVAVIHRFEELPPGSTLIFYRYCDHENAAYKNTFLIFTVLLGEEEISAKSRLSTVEEMVDDHLQRKFLSDDQPVSFDRMDLDKYGGLWSRISHLILPVTAEERVEREGC